MNEEIKLIWIDALTSGEYWQGRDQIRDYDRFCCLGVLCDLHFKMTGDGYWKDMYYVTDKEEEEYVLPDKVQKWAGLESDDGFFGESSLTTENDSGKNFRKIAELIEEHF